MPLKALFTGTNTVNGPREVKGHDMSLSETAEITFAQHCMCLFYIRIIRNFNMLDKVDT